MKTTLPFAGLVLCLLTCAAPAAPAAVPDAALATAKASLADPLLPALALPEEAKPSAPPREWAPREKEVLCLPLSNGALLRALPRSCHHRPTAARRAPRELVKRGNLLG